MNDIIALARSTSKPDIAEPLRVHFETRILERVAWDRNALESKLNVSLPEQLLALWNVASSLRLFEDRTYGQWGLVVLPPATAVEETEFRMRSGPAQRIRPGDLVVGRFLGDSDLLLLRCESGADDFGRVLVELPVYPRSEWPPVGTTLDGFLRKYIQEMGEKFWIRKRV